MENANIFSWFFVFKFEHDKEYNHEETKSK